MSMTSGQILSGPVTRQLTGHESISTDNYLICYFLSGTAEVTTGGFSAVHKRDSFLLLPPGHSAEIVPDPESVLMTIGISRDFVQDHLDRISLPVCGSELDQNHNYQLLKKHVLDLAGYLQDDAESSGLSVTGTLFLLLAEFGHLPHQLSASSGDRKFRERVQSIAEYISLHYNEAITLTELARVFYLTPQYLSTFFQKYFGTNFKSYLNERRLFYSLRDLRHTRLTISEIALKNGFSSISAYRRNFQKTYGTSPSDFRTAYLAGKPEYGNGSMDLPAVPSDPGISSIHENGAGAASSLRQSVEISVSAGTVTHASVHTMINIGSVQNMLSESFRRELLEFKEKTGIRRIRMQGVLSGSFIPMVLPHYEYYFRNVDTVLTWLYENGISPFIELSRLPFRAPEGSTSQDIYIPRGPRFMKLLESLLLHVTRRWPVSWLESWEFELWMLPRDTPASYARDFSKIREMIRSFIPGAGVGGPGWDTFSSARDLHGLLHVFASENVRPDFFSASLSCLTRADAQGQPPVSLDEDFPRQTVRMIRRELDAADFRIPLYITEWTSVWTTGIPVTCSRFQAAFITRTFLMLDSECDLAAYWRFCDQNGSSQEMTKESLTIFGDGLISAGFLPYASFYAWLFCSGLGRDVVSEGSFYRLVKQGDLHYQLLTWHYEHFRSASEVLFRDVTDFDSVYSLFRDAPSYRLDITLTGLPEGLYHISRMYLGEFSGSLLDILIGEYTHSNIDKIDFLQNIPALPGFGSSFRLRSCVPEERSAYTKVDGNLNIQASLPPHTVCLWDIRRQR